MKTKQRRLASVWGILLCAVAFAFVANGCAKSRSPSSQPRQSNAKKDQAPSGRKGKVEEADLYRITGTTMLYLHTYKGLAIIDLKDAKKPTLAAHLPVYGFPLEMYIDGHIATILVRDAMELVQKKKGSEYRLLRRSQLITVDMKDPKRPKILQRFDIAGQLREGVSRKIGRTLYVVSYQSQWHGYYYRTWRPKSKPEVTVYSFFLAPSGKVRQVQKMALIGNYRPPLHPRRKKERHSMIGVTITGTANTLLVAERRRYSWHHRFFLLFSDYEYYSYTRMHIVDISNPKGLIRLHTRFQIRGDVEDQFKQTYRYDPKTKKALYLGIAKRNEWRARNAGWGTVWLQKNELWSVDVTDGKAPKILDTLAFGKPRETVRGTVFDPARKVVFAITAIQRDPLYAISFKDPKKLKILSAIDGLSGDMNLFRFIAKKKFLLAVGRDFSSACTGFGKDNRGSKVSVSIIDVRDLRRIRLVQRKCVKLKHALWASSQVNANRDQAHKMIGFFDDGKTRLLTVPVTYYEKTKNRHDWWYHRRSAVGMMTWDLAKYDPKKSEKEQSVLRNLGTFVHPSGSVRRTIIHELPQAGGPRRTLLNISNNHLSLIDLEQPTKPKRLSSLELSSSTHRLFRFGQHRVELVNWSPRGYTGAYKRNVLRVRAWMPDANGKTPVLKTIPLGRFRTVMQWKHLLLVFRYPIKRSRLKGGWFSYDYGNTELVVYDFRNPLQPKRRGSVQIREYLYFSNQYSCSDGREQRFAWAAGRRSVYVDWLSTSRGVLASRNHHIRDWGGERTGRYQMKLIDFDLSNPDAPKVTKFAVGRHEKMAKIIRWKPDAFFLTYESYIDRGWRGKGYSYESRLVHWNHGKKRWVGSSLRETKEKLLAAEVHHGATTFVVFQPLRRKLEFRRGTTLAKAKRVGDVVTIKKGDVNLAGRDGHFALFLHTSPKTLAYQFSWDGKTFQQKAPRLLFSQRASIVCVSQGKVFAELKGMVAALDLNRTDSVLHSKNIRPFHYWHGNTVVSLAIKGDRAWLSGGPYGSIPMSLAPAQQIAQPATDKRPKSTSVPARQIPAPASRPSK